MLNKWLLWIFLVLSRATALARGVKEPSKALNCMFSAFSLHQNSYMLYTVPHKTEIGAAAVGRLYVEQYSGALPSDTPGLSPTPSVALDKFEHRSDCFRRVSTEYLRGRCDRLEIDETARVRGT